MVRIVMPAAKLTPRRTVKKSMTWNNLIHSEYRSLFVCYYAKYNLSESYDGKTKAGAMVTQMGEIRPTFI